MSVASAAGGLLARCTFPPAGTPVRCGLSGGPDSVALVALAMAAGCDVVAVHVDHGLREGSVDDADTARALAAAFRTTFELHRLEIPDGANLEARARAARLAVLGRDALLGHTADDQAETVLLNMLRGTGLQGLSGIAPGPTHPILALRRAETVGLAAEVADELDVRIVDDPSNDDARFRRNRVRHELIPLLNDVAERDVVPLLARLADTARDDVGMLDLLAGDLDPTDARSLAAAPVALARRSLRRWLAADGYPPDAASVERVLHVARGDAVACEITGGRRVHRRRGRLSLDTIQPVASS